MDFKGVQMPEIMCRGAYMCVCACHSMYLRESSWGGGRGMSIALIRFSETCVQQRWFKRTLLLDKICVLRKHLEGPSF